MKRTRASLLHVFGVPFRVAGPEVRVRGSAFGPCAAMLRPCVLMSWFWTLPFPVRGLVMFVSVLIPPVFAPVWHVCDAQCSVRGAVVRVVGYMGASLVAVIRLRDAG